MKVIFIIFLKFDALFFIETLKDSLKIFTFLLWHVIEITSYHVDCFFPSLKITYLTQFGIYIQIR